MNDECTVVLNYSNYQTYLLILIELWYTVDAPDPWRLCIDLENPLKDDAEKEFLKRYHQN